ncbi:MAG: PhoPQ-activated pathogenicity-related family protein [Pirellulales bacterium]|nr:PhoPQ-activated pathogenicity-related family protein [Pirellulales bacterium]
MRPTLLRGFCGGLLLLAWAVGMPCARAEETALDRYLAQPDPAYGWKLVDSHPGELHGQAYTAHVLELTSQTWRSTAEVDRPVWKHWLTIVCPAKVRPGVGFLFIGGGNNNDPAPTAASERVAALAVGTQTVVAELGMVPNQPLTFRDTPDAHRFEDDLIAYSRVRYMATRDELWLVRLAMVKSAVRALDAMTEFAASEAGGKLALERFVVAGGSKRGWTTWLTAVEDPRVIAIVPLVIDALNSEAITRHHLAAYGFFSSALDDYVKHGLFPGKLGTPEYRAVLAIEDPYQYRQRDRLRIPKLLINAAGDEFFLPDNSHLYYHEMPEEKHLRYVPNAKHSLAGSDARETLQAFYECVLHHKARPRFGWQRTAAGTLHVTADDPPREVKLWQATNPQARDFRLDVIGPAYLSTPVAAAAPGVFEVTVAAPATGYTAFFLELTFDVGASYPLKLTTDVCVVPDVLPFAEKAGLAPGGK